ncbi:Putative U2 small nuclear ribonucleoprotein auxiliary factor 35 kDa subunit-related protein 1,U2 small nuclear ribonucleoprotein auxiliary factor 35 kDa subunit-related protein 1,Zinc finger CCCH domain-containing protein 16,Zinc finger CCCH domain-containing protein 5,U2 small nuclear ribonucleoprotein auxiliary factor 35 kDa subunit-related protein 2 [Mytilus coruscus]|uniref:Uncharacterized protein n=1 Tax=Mytilus coruscus TaxID=42192 RepID=A0A6J8EMC6_MYTCO|nr:Putative U2 small nuclear ribonucleoprotein auxiliary factor 35 kDa subunit-related protein 1,U2 small nuclear ribonucleoprotein auxiliary factor 35 kDa subunit-related protein 1,Zinc finger CCCH domain-containing protein 16,Zinc finger CCCH domain-containing protein 5,U2 small nuclear ribonucleoprotein auxiliary factor 35 kDa subunit-related protein 2 [Mytilus coruscus]
MENKDIISDSDQIPDNNSTPQQVKFSHKQWKALLKKQKRKRKRQNEALMRDKKDEEEQRKKEESPSFQAKERQRKEIEQLEEKREKAEKIYFNKLWMEKERLALEEFERKKKWEENEKIRREDMEKKIKEEWEERQKKEKEEKEKEEKRKNQQDSLLKQATANENKEGEEPWHNPIASLIPGKERETCPFFAKTGACRFNERCSRGHPEPDTSTTILMRGMYSHFELEQGLLDENDTDLILEYEEGELYNNFRDFYDDIVPEFKAVGKVVQVKVCCNYEPHLRGNVYIQFASDEEALAAMVKMNGRFYAGKQISCEPVVIKSWKSAICGLFGRGRCPKGRNCNFLHVFKNPRNEFWEYDKPQNNSHNRQIRSQRSSRYTRSRSRSPYKRSHDRHSYSRDRFNDNHRSRSKYRSRSHRYSRSRSRDKYSRSHSRGKRYSRSRSRSRSKRKSIERSPNHYSKRKRYSKSRSRERERNRCSRSRSRSQSRAISKDRSVRQVSKQKRSRSRSFSRSRSTSRSPRRHSNKKKKHKHKKSKKHSGSDITSFKTSLNGEISTDQETSLSKENSEQSVLVE